MCTQTFLAIILNILMFLQAKPKHINLDISTIELMSYNGSLIEVCRYCLVRCRKSERHFYVMSSYQGFSDPNLHSAHALCPSVVWPLHSSILFQSTNAGAFHILSLRCEDIRRGSFTVGLFYREIWLSPITRFSKVMVRWLKSC